MPRGIKERFGEDIVERLEKLGQIKQSVKTDSGATAHFMLTKAVCASGLANATLRMHWPARRCGWLASAACRNAALHSYKCMQGTTWC